MRVPPRPRAARGKTNRLRAHPRSARRGTVLIVALWIVFGLAGLTLVMARSVRVEALVSANQFAAAQAAAVERGAEQYVLWLIEQNQDEVLDLSEQSFEAIPVGDGWFWIIRPDYGDDTLPAYGLVDEASKVNLNTAPPEMLAALPGMDLELADAICDWRDADSDISEGGAENEYYMSLPEPYYCKNAPLETVEELLLVKDIDRQLLYGTGDRPSSIGGDTERDRPSAGASNVTRMGEVSDEAGLYDYVTVHSVPSSASASGEAMADVNSNDRQPLEQLLSGAFDAATAQRIVQLARDERRRERFNSVLDFAVRVGLTSQQLQAIADRLTIGGQATAGGKVNINTAPGDVLLCLPGLDEADVANLLSQRAGDNVDRTSVAWVLDVLPAPKVSAIGPWVTGRPSRYSADIVATSGNGRAYRRCRIIVDAGGTTPRIVYRIDLTERGWPLDRQILLDLRAGNGPQGGGRQTLTRSAL